MPVITYRDAIHDALREALIKDERVFIMGEDIGPYGGSYAVTKGFIDEFGPQRIIDTPIAESGFVGAGVGAAMNGMRPVVEIMTINFSLLALDQIVNNAAKIRSMSGGQVKIPLIVRTVSGGGNQLAATHSQSLEHWYATVPGLKVVCPSTPYDIKGLFRASMQDENPILFVEHSLLYRSRGEVPEGDYTVPIGLSDVKRQGKDVTLVSYSRMVHLALSAAEKLAQEGIDCEVVDLRTLRPLDSNTVVKSVMKTNRAVLIEETWKSGGFMAEVASRIYEEAFDYLDGPVKRIAGKEVPLPYARNLELAAMPSEAEVLQAVHDLMGR